MFVEPHQLHRAWRRFDDIGWSVRQDIALDDHVLKSTLVWQDHRSTLRVKLFDYDGSAAISLWFADHLVATVFPLSRSISIWHRPLIPFDELEHVLLNQVMPRILAHDDHAIYHAGFAADNSGGIAFCGPSGSGKSTLVASLQKAGLTLHGDDGFIAEVCGTRFLGRAVYRSLRIRPDTLERLFPHGLKACDVPRYNNKLRVKLPEGEDDTLPPVPLTGIVFLVAPPPEDRISLRRMRPAEACMALIENSFALDPTDRERARQKLVMASELAAAVPAYELSYPRDYSRLDDVQRALVKEDILPAPDHDAVSPERRA